uniref:Uncharacterized protein n=1 Tax=Panagrolaimus superbus TaxID=310955 RepID=A0A914XX57_9BILA
MLLDFQLNTSFVGHSDGFLVEKCKRIQCYLQTQTFDGSGNLQIDILNSTKEIPYFLRIGQNQPVPSLKFQFHRCIGSKFEIYLNLHDNLECRTAITVTQNGFAISTKNVASPLSVHEFDACEIPNPSNVPADQLVLQLNRFGIAAGCAKAQVVLPKADVFQGIEALIDRSKIVDIPDETENNATISASTKPAALKTGSAADNNDTASAGLPWWWIMIIAM